MLRHGMISIFQRFRWAFGTLQCLWKHRGALAEGRPRGLAWIGMMAKDDRPFILQKAGGLQGTFTYIAFAPARNAAVFIALNKFDFGAAFVMGRFANELLEQIAPR